MAHIIKEDKAEPMRDYAVFVIVSPFDDKTFYISKTGQARLRKAYAEHFGLRVVKTKALFERAKKENKLPALYILEAGKMSGREAFRRCVAWTRYFLEHGFAQVSKDILTEYAHSLTDSTEAFYEKIKDESLDNVLQPEGGVFPEYGKRNRVGNENRNVNLAVPVPFEESEYAVIKEQASELGLTLGAYCKRMVLNGRILQMDFNVIGKYLNELSSCNALLKQILYSIYSTGNYYPADLENIQTSINRITEIQKQVNDEIAKTVRTLRE